MNEIKVGDIVRVSEDVPKMYVLGWGMLLKCNDCKVLVIEDDNAVIEYGPSKTTIPTKYLTKVNAEPKEQEIKAGDKVLAMKTDCISPLDQKDIFRRNVSLVTSIKDGYASLFFIDEYGGNHYAQAPIECLKKVDAKPNEQADSFIVTEDAIGISIDKWRQYEADLAKEIALKIANPCNYNEKTVADYAVNVAKSVVENLKESER